MTRRTEQIGDLLKEELSDLINRSLKDPRLGFVTLTDVEVTRDLHQARVFFSVLGDEEAMQSSLEALQAARGYLQRELLQRLDLRFVPELTFVIDRSVEYGQHISDLLRQASQQGETLEDTEHDTDLDTDTTDTRSTD